MSTKIEIANLGLGHIGQATIQSLTENSVQADAIERIYDSSLAETLRAYDWPFARVTRVLVAITDYDTLDWIYGYAYPANCVAIRQVVNESTPQDKRGIGEEFEEIFDVDTAVRVIATDVPDAYGKYTYLVTDTTIYDASFVNAFSHRLASDLAVDLNGDQEMAKGEIIIFNGLISEAKRIASNEKNKPRKEVSSYVDARE